jgi:protoporphyrinogen oxidase
LTKYKFIILGAGPTGLSIAHSLLNYGEKSFLILEKEPVAGGLCRSEFVDGAPIDMGGGHFLDDKNKIVKDYLFRFLPKEEWNKFIRISKIKLKGSLIDYPIEANIWQLSVDDQVDYLDSIAKTGSVCGKRIPKTFKNWITWKLGKRIAEEYMIPYNKKLWSINLNTLGVYWLKKLPDVSFRETLFSCLTRKPHGKLPAHQTFLYPKHFGYGEVWKRMGNALCEHLLISTPVSHIDIIKRIVNVDFQANYIINTIPWTVWPHIADIPYPIKRDIKKLCFSSIDIDYYSDNIESDAHWIYVPDENETYHRILCRKNFSPGSIGYWTETNTKRVTTSSYWSHRNKWAYPLNTIKKPEAIKNVLEWARSLKIYGVGRWGMWEHINSDVAVENGIKIAKSLLRIENR